MFDPSIKPVINWTHLRKEITDENSFGVALCQILDVCNGSFFTIIVLLVVLLFVDLLIVKSMFCLIY